MIKLNIVFIGNILFYLVVTDESIMFENALKKHVFRAFLSHMGIFGDFSISKLEIIGNESISDQNGDNFVTKFSKDIFVEKRSKYRFPKMEIEKSPFLYF